MGDDVRVGAESYRWMSMQTVESFYHCVQSHNHEKSEKHQ